MRGGWGSICTLRAAQEAAKNQETNKHGRLGKGKVERRALGERLSKTKGLMELGKDVKLGSNMTVVFWQREEKRNYLSLYA